MKIIFLCGSLEPGRDGVGDYTRRLAAELKKNAHEAAIIALCDNTVALVTSGSQKVDEVSIPVLRIPVTISNKNRFKKSKEYIQAFEPDWLSLQYVPFSFNPRGLHYGLARKLSGIAEGRPWQIMFHELWVGRDQHSSTRQKLLSYLQQSLIKRMAGRLKPVVVHTHLPLYQQKLNKIGVVASALPLFSNISVSQPIVNNKPAKTFRFAFFSQVETSGPIVDFINKFSASITSKGYQPELVLIGGNQHRMEQVAGAFKNACPGLVQVSTTGFLEEAEISKVIGECDLGLTSVPTHALGKSGSVAAFLAHGVPVGAPIVHLKNGHEEVGFFSETGKGAVLTTPAWEKYEQVSRTAFRVRQEIHVVTISNLFCSALVDKHYKN